MKAKLKLHFLLLLAVLCVPVLVNAQGTLFNYQGQLKDNGSFANGRYDLRFSLYPSSIGGGQFGPTITRTVDVTNGQFTTDMDFGGNFNGTPRWLQLEVRTNGGGAFAPLSSRQQITPTPYAIYAGNAATAVTASNVVSGSVVTSLNSLKDNVTLAAGTNVTLTPNGNTLTIAAAGPGGSGIWSVNGNNAYYNSGNVGIGTATPVSKLTLLTTPNNYGFEHTDGSVRLGTFLGGSAGGGWLGTRSNHKLSFFVNDGSASMTLDTNGYVGIGTLSPKHGLSLAAGPSWTANAWIGAAELVNGGAIGWQANGAGQRFGMGHSGGGFFLFRTSSNPGTTGSSALYDFLVDDSGNVGIGTTSPFAGYRLTVSGQTVMSPGGSGGGNIAFGTPNGETGITISTNTGNRADVRFDGTTLKMVVGPPGGPPSSANGITINASGKVGIGGSLFPVAQLEVVGQDALRLIGYQPFLTLLDNNAGYARSRIQSAGGEMILVPESYLNGSDGNAYVKLFNSGNLSVKTLTIRGGADLAEPFEFSENDIAKGSVLVIDDEQPGKLKLSTRAYDTRVAGIVSGANGVNPGISLHQDGVVGSGRDVALSGRVYVLADSTRGEIRPGDLLTTSDTPGHAMKVANHTQSQGAILGKAMSTLKDGKGMVLVLVTLQ